MTISGITNPPMPARLAIGIISAGRVGCALGEALERVGHVVWAVAARSDASRARAAARLPEARVLPSAEIAARSELLLLAVPDTALPEVVDEVAVHVRPGTVVVHTAGAHGVAVLAPLVAAGAMPLAIHPAMTFTGDAADADRLADAAFGVTAADGVGHAVAQMLVWELGGRAVPVAEHARTAYHAALAHGSNHLVTLIADAADVLAAALSEPTGAPRPDADEVTATGAHRPGDGIGPWSEDVTRILRPLLGAALDNVLAQGFAALTGPVRRGDAGTVASHLDAIADIDAGLAGFYRAASLRTALRAEALPESASGSRGPLVGILQEDQ